MEAGNRKNNKSIRIKTEDFDYTLPEELIAQEPLPARDSSKMLVLNRQRGHLEHTSFRELPRFLKAGDLMVFNDTKVIPARLLGHRKDTGGSVELLLLRRLEETKWEVLSSPGKRTEPKTVLSFGGGLLEAEVLEKTAAGGRIVSFRGKGSSLEHLLYSLGRVPLPPYIKREEREEGRDNLIGDMVFAAKKGNCTDSRRYQTVYACKEGSAAAPTAGLHFTQDLLQGLQERGIGQVFLTLHIGVGTFRPVKARFVEEHIMHSEHFELTAIAAERINTARRQGKRVVAVGTTCCRVLETMTFADGTVRSGSGETNLFIYPGYRFKAVDALLTNFHLPRSTLLMLICALAGRNNVLKAYGEAVELQYRFYSFGDCMLII